MVLEKTPESPLDGKEIKTVNPKGNQSWIFFGRTNAEAPILWPPDGKNWLIGKVPDTGKDWRWEEKGMTEIEMVGWHHWLNGHEFKQALGVGDGQGSLECHSPWDCKDSGKNEQLNWTELKIIILPRIYMYVKEKSSEHWDQYCRKLRSQEEEEEEPSMKSKSIQWGRRRIRMIHQK